MSAQSDQRDTTGDQSLAAPTPSEAPTSGAPGLVPRLGVVIPVYRNEGSIEALLAALVDIETKLAEPIEVVLVVDGSPDSSAAMLSALLPDTSLDATLVQLSRNFGSFSAIRCGLEVARAEFVAVMAADLQEPPELVIDALVALRERRAQIVVGTRESRPDDSFGVRFTSKIFWTLYRRLVQRDMPPGGIDVFAVNHEARRAILDMGESRTSLVGQILWVGFERLEIPYTRRARQGGGRSGWNFKKRFAYMLDSLFSFTDLPIQVMLAIGIIGLTATTVAATVVLVAWALGGIDVPGYTATFLAVSFAGAANLAGLGIVGSYTFRAYENGKARPQFIQASVRRFRVVDTDLPTITRLGGAGAIQTGMPSDGRAGADQHTVTSVDQGVGLDDHSVNGAGGIGEAADRGALGGC